MRPSPAAAGGWWRALWRRHAAAPALPGERWVVLDVESSGLDPSRDRLLAIAAVAVRWHGARPVIELADAFEAVLGAGQAQSVASKAAEARAARGQGRGHVDRANILVHGIGVGAQARGQPPAQALADFLGWAGEAPRLGFHVDFDRVLIERACRQHLGPAAAGHARWLDLAPLAALTHPQVAARALDDWLAHFGITCLQRHAATADALATAELLLRLWPALQREGATGFEACRRLAANRRWMPSQA